jgi:hypothetical protein
VSRTPSVTGGSGRGSSPVSPLPMTEAGLEIIATARMGDSYRVSTHQLYGLTWLGDSASLSQLSLMVPPNRARWAFAASLLLTAAFAAGLAGEFVHTDDGCQVEVHCIACQRVLLSVSTGAMAPPWHPSIEPVGRVTSHDPIPTHVAETHASASRGPPLA